MTNLIELIRKNLGYPELRKIDPNIQDIKPDDKNFGLHNTSQAAIPAIICGLSYRLTTFEAVDRVLTNEKRQWMDSIFGKEKEELISRISDYSGTKKDVVSQECDHIAAEAIRLVREHIPGTSNPAAMALFLAEERANALLYLPGSLQLGKLLNDDQLDDRTHKMEGPVSSLMHAVEKQL